MGNSIELIVMQLVIIFFAIGLHEYAHCKFSDMAGDDTARLQGRVTLNLFKHFDPIGAIFIVLTSIVGFGFGWGKPAPFDPRKMRNPRWDIFASVAAGPLSNVLQAVLYAAVFRFGGDALPPLAQTFLMLGVILNLGLAVFNMIPLIPLDGHWLVGMLLPPKASYSWFAFQRSLGPFALIGLIVLIQILGFSPTGPLTWPLYELLTGDEGHQRLRTYVEALRGR